MNLLSIVYNTICILLDLFYFYTLYSSSCVAKQELKVFYIGRKTYHPILQMMWVMSADWENRLQYYPNAASSSSIVMNPAGRKSSSFASSKENSEAREARKHPNSVFSEHLITSLARLVAATTIFSSRSLLQSGLVITGTLITVSCLLPGWYWSSLTRKLKQLIGNWEYVRNCEETTTITHILNFYLTFSPFEALKSFGLIS